MILDERLEFSDAGALATGTGRSLHGDVIDLGATPQDYGVGCPMYLVIQVTTSVAGTSSTVSFELVSDAAAAIATNGTATEHLVTELIPEATLVAGWQRAYLMPPGLADNQYERYLGVITNVGTAVLSAGAINAFLTKDAALWRSYPDATN
jgi:hypothetical protein